MDPADQLPPPGRCPARVYRPRNAGLRRILAACYVPDGVADGERWHLGRMHSDFGAADTTDTARLGPASCPAAQRLSGRSRAVPVGGSVTARLRSWAPARRHRPRAAGAAIALFVLLVSAACTSTADPDLPSTAYRHEPLQETSVAGPVTASGDTAVLASSLADQGFACAQVRSNDVALHVWCRHRTVDDTGEKTAVANIIADRAGSLEYAQIELDGGASAPGSEWDRLREVLGATLVRLWPEDDGAITKTLDDERERQDRNSERARTDPPPADGLTTDRATYTVPSPGTFTAQATGVNDPRWPYGADHYATTMTEALPGLTAAGGFECYYPPQQTCNRPDANQGFAVTLRDDQILSAEFRVGTTVRDGEPQTTLADEGFPRGLSFLTDRVETAVLDQLQEARRTGQGFTGPVSGVLLVIDPAQPDLPDDGSFAQSFRVQIGAPLIGVR